MSLSTSAPPLPLLNRSPHSRKSLAPPSSGPSAIPVPKRKRAYSIAPGEKFNIDDSRRRSLMRPAKGILKPSNQGDDDVSQYPSLDDSSTTDFRTLVTDNTTRRSLGSRRVSFAAHAHVRVFQSLEQNGSGSESPAASPPSASALASTIPPEHPAPPSPGRASLDRRRSSMHPLPPYDGGEGEESMELTLDEIPQPSAPPLQPPRSPTSQRAARNSVAEDEDAGDMSITDDFGPGILARGRALSLAGRERRPSARMRSSLVAPASEDGEETMEFTVALDRPPPEESDAFKALRAVANANARTRASMRGEADASVDMDVSTALTRLMHVRDGMDGVDAGAALGGEDSFSSGTGEESFDADDQTMNVTSVMGDLRVSEDVGGEDGEGDKDNDAMSVASVVTGHISMPAPSSTAAVSVPTFSKPAVSISPVKTQPVASSSKGTPGQRGVWASPTKSQEKPPPRQFTAAFAPSYQPPKRPFPPQSPSPNKRRVVSVSSNGILEGKRVSFPVPTLASARPVKGAAARKSLSLSQGARRPSEQLWKSGASPQKKTSGGSPDKKSVGVERNLGVKASPFSVGAMERRKEELGDGDRGAVKARAGSPALVEQGPSAKATVVSDNAVDERPSSQGDVGADGEEGDEVSPDRPEKKIDVNDWDSTTQEEKDVTRMQLREDEMEPISVENFFAMTGIRFMDDLTCPRRSTVHPAQLQRRDSNECEEYSLADYAVAMAVGVAQLETMIWIANDIRSAIQKFKTQYRQTEEDAAKDMPLLFREYANVDEKGREQLLYVLKLIKAHTIGSAKASWYEWKRGWVQALQKNAQRTLDNLDVDQRQLDNVASRAQESLPGLRTEYEQIMRELEQEKAAIAEIENCDQEYLSELKATIAEQRQELDVYQNDVQESEKGLARLEETLEDLQDQAREAKVAISAAQRHVDLQKSSAPAEALRLRDELRCLQALHLWRETALRADLIEYVYDLKHRVVIPCRRFTPVPEALDVSPVEDTSGEMQVQDDFPLLTEMMYCVARRHAIQDRDSKVTLRMIIQRLTDFWASYAQIRAQLRFLVIKYPVALELIPPNASPEEAEGFKGTATLHLLEKRCKMHVNFYFDQKMLGGWPMTIPLLQLDFSVVYGHIDPGVVKEVIRKRLSTLSIYDNHACLADMCTEIVNQCS